MIYLMVIILCLVLSGICKSIMDLLVFNKPCIFVKPNNKWFNYPSITWRNKYREDMKTPKFFGSTTFLVFITDAWHFFQMLNNILLVFPIAFLLVNDVYYIILATILLNILRNSVFEIFYSQIFKN